jgi:murein DD-endopeptidase MepM/ murein hydrolase activator NlpD
LAFAFDFDGVMGDKVVAIRPGTVLKQNETVNGSTPWAGKYVVVDHGDGTVALYAHLSTVNVGANCCVQGELIGLVGNTGAVKITPPGDGTHLHIQVMNKSEYQTLEASRPHGGISAQSRPFTFDDFDVQRDGGVPQTGKSYTSDNLR